MNEDLIIVIIGLLVVISQVVLFVTGYWFGYQARIREQEKQGYIQAVKDNSFKK